MQEISSISEKLNSQNKSSFFIKMYNHILQVENAIKIEKHIADYRLNFTVLVTLSEAQSTDKNYKQNLRDKIDKKATTAIFNNPNVGNIYSVGLFTNMFIEMVGKKVLGSMDGGLYGILRGLDMDADCAINCIKKLRDGNYMVIASGDPEDIAKLKAQFGNNC